MEEGGGVCGVVQTTLLCEGLRMNRGIAFHSHSQVLKYWDI